MRHALIIGLAIFLACLAGNTARMLIASETVDWDVADSAGHGPDRGSREWQGALKKQARSAGIRYGLVTFVLATGLGYVGHYTHRQRKQLKR